MAEYRYLIPEGAETIDVPLTLSREQARLVAGRHYRRSTDEKNEIKAAWELLKRACQRSLELEGGDVQRHRPADLRGPDVREAEGSKGDGDPPPTDMEMLDVP